MANADDDTEDSSKPHVPTKDYSIKVQLMTLSILISIYPDNHPISLSLYIY